VRQLNKEVLPLFGLPTRAICIFFFTYYLNLQK